MKTPVVLSTLLLYIYVLSHFFTPSLTLNLYTITMANVFQKSLVQEPFLAPVEKKQHMLVRYVLKHGSWFKLVLSWL